MDDMVNVNNYGSRMQPSVHWGRQNLNARYQRHATMYALNNASLFNVGSQNTTITYNVGPSNSMMAGHVIGTLVGNLPKIVTGATNLWQKIFG